MSENPPVDFLDLAGHKQNLLMSIYVHGPGSGRDLNDRTGATVEPQTTYRYLSDLKDDGYVEVGQKDGRENRYELTRKGKSFVEDAREWMDL